MASVFSIKLILGAGIGGLGMGINLKRKKFSLNGYLGANYNSSNGFGTNVGTTTDLSGRSGIGGYTSDSWNTWQYYSLKGAYHINKRQTLSFGFKGNGSFSGGTDDSYQQYFQNDSLVSSFNTNADRSYKWINNSAFINYVIETDSFHSALEFNLNFVTKTSNGKNLANTLFENPQDNIITNFDIKRDNKDQPKIGELRLNYDHVFDTTGWELSVGGYYSLLYNGLEYNQYGLVDNDWISNPLFSNSYDYTEHIGALYAELSKKWKSVGFRVGVRGEYALLNGYSNSLNQQFIDSSYILPFPTASLLLEPNDKLGITLAYSAGIDRPQFSNYDPFVRIIDSLTIETGNPYLRPSTSHTYSLDFDIMYAYNISFSYTYTKDPSSHLYLLDENAFLLTGTPWNAAFNQEATMSISLPFSFPWLQGWNSAWVSYGKTNFTDIFERDPYFNVTFGVFSYLTFILPKDFSIMNRLHIMKWGNELFNPNAMVNWGLRLSKKMLDNNLQLYFEVDNIFPPKRINDSFYGAYQENSNSQDQFTNFKLGFYYKFGRLKRSTDIKESSSGQSGRI